MKKTQILMIIMVLLLSCLVAACTIGAGDEPPKEADQPQPLLWKIAYDVAETHSLHQELLEKADWLENASEGQIQVELYPLYQLGDDADMLPLAASGVIQMTLPQTSSLAALPENDYPLEISADWQAWGGLDGFYRYFSPESAQAAMAGDLGGAMTAALSALPGQPLSCLGYAYEGPLVIGAKTDVLVPADLAGQRIAVIGSPQWLDAYRGRAAATVSLPLSEVYPALARDTVTAYQASAENIATMYWHEHSSFVTLTEHGYVFRPLLVNRQWYESLAEEQASLVDAAVAGLLQRLSEQAESNYQAAVEKLRQQGMTVNELTEEQRALWQDLQ